MRKIIGRMKKCFLLIYCFVLHTSLWAQTDQLKLANTLLEKNQSALGISEKDIAENLIITDTYFDKISGTTLVYLQQSYLGLPVYNQMQILAFKNNELVSNTGGRIFDIEKIINGHSGIPEVSAEKAVITAVKNRKLPYFRNPFVLSSEKNGHFLLFDNMNICSKNISAELMWVPLEEGRKMVLAWQIYLVPSTTSDYWMVRVDAISNKVIGVNNFTVYCKWDHNEKKENKMLETLQPIQPSRNLFVNFQAPSPIKNQEKTSSPMAINNYTYRVVPFPYESPSHYLVGHTDSTALVTNPWDSLNGHMAGSLQWHNNGTTTYDSLRGNNVFAQEDRNGNNGTGASAIGSTSGDTLYFNFKPNFRVAPTQTTPVKNQPFNITNLFYWNNIVHDLSYLYGFDEVAGNFQNSNQGRGGLGNDYVIADAQDGSGSNNANFSTPSDGDNGRMQMYLWSGSPQKDGDADAGVICHEFTHGISNRLTGGPSQAGCLNNAENMGEGWSDYYALMFTQNWATSTLNSGFTTPRPVGTYVMGQANTGMGIRTKKYSTDSTVNNLKFSSRLPTETHDLGEIWCAVLWDMTWKIINETRVINPNLYDTSNNEGGNSIALKLVTYAMKIQPCSPGFIDGRNAILKADSILYNQRFSCAISEVFRRRGMGKNASQGSSNSLTDQVADFGSSFISKHPSDAAACIGSNATFSATTIGVNNNFQWKVSVDGGNTYTNLVNETNSILTINNIQASMNNYKYQLLIINPTCGAITTNSATLRVLPVLTSNNYTINPSQSRICAGSSTTFELIAAVTSPYNKFQYQWQFYNTLNNNFVNSVNDTTNILTLSNIPDSFNDRKYRLIIKDLCGFDTSDLGELSVIPLPTITTVANPSNLLLPGQTASINVATNAISDSIQWYFNNSIMPNQTGTVLYLNLNNEGIYYVTATKDGCSNTSTPINIIASIPESLIVYPNPNKGIFQVIIAGITDADNDRTISMYDTKGSLVYSKHYQNIPLTQKFFDVSASNLSKGIYMLVVVDKNGKKVSKCKVMIR